MQNTYVRHTPPKVARAARVPPLKGAMWGRCKQQVEHPGRQKTNARHYKLSLHIFLFAECYEYFPNNARGEAWQPASADLNDRKWSHIMASVQNIDRNDGLYYPLALGLDRQVNAKLSQDVL